MKKIQIKWSLPFTEREAMTKRRWIFLFIIIISIILSILFIFYLNTMNPDSKLSKQAIERLNEVAEVKQVLDVEHYHGENSYRVIEAETATKNGYFFVPDEKEEEIIFVEKENGISKEDAKNVILNEKEDIEILNIRLAIDGKKPLWEIVYKEKNGQRTFFYITYKSGEFYKRLTISK
jgi:uncharacterized protein YpmB